MKPLFFSVGFIFFVLVALAFRPVPIVPESDCLTQTGIVTAVFEGGEKDVNIQLEGIDELFYINRGLEKGLELDQVRSGLIGYEVTLKYPKHWTPLDPLDRTHHISVVRKGDQLIYSELD